MSECFINIRIAWWHIQALRGSLWKWRISSNDFWRERGKWKREPVAIYEFNLRDGWTSRKDGVSVAVNIRRPPTKEKK